ncbi:uncharacterized protein LOC141658900 [Silene latifolia]|uniref:uncharacterized protein LOC141658900 n=1 Tax=Silene latifolia TaxID=37657 RepID=UPI003D77FFE3
MVGIFPKLSSTNSVHRRTQSALDQREVLPSNPEAVAAGVTHGVGATIEFKPVEHPMEPLDNDRPVQCPQPEPSILNDGRIWKERVSAANERRRADLPLMKEGDSSGTRSQHASSNRMILPSISAPEHNILHFLDECNASTM